MLVWPDLNWPGWLPLPAWPELPDRPELTWVAACACVAWTAWPAKTDLGVCLCLFDLNSLNCLTGLIWAFCLPVPVWPKLPDRPELTWVAACACVAWTAWPAWTDLGGCLSLFDLNYLTGQNWPGWLPVPVWPELPDLTWEAAWACLTWNAWNAWTDQSGCLCLTGLTAWTDLGGCLCLFGLNCLTGRFTGGRLRSPRLCTLYRGPCTPGISLLRMSSLFVRMSSLYVRMSSLITCCPNPSKKFFLNQYYIHICKCTIIF